MSATRLERIKQVAAAPLFFSLSSEDLTIDEQKLLRKTAPSGMIYFKRNISEINQLSELVNSVSSVAPVLFHAVDEEGGRVKRLPDGEWSLPSAALQAQWTEKQLYRAVLRLGSTLRSCGINLDFAPVADIAASADSSIVGDRSFGSTAEVVSEKAGIVVEALQKSGVHAVLKHFPGHGVTKIDSHTSLPVITKSLQQLRTFDMVPFMALKDAVSFIMTAHLIMPDISSEPVSLSEKWNRLLRDDIGFSGVIITDDLEMGALASLSLAERISRFYQSGADMTLICSGKESALFEAWEASVSFLEQHPHVIEANERLRTRLHIVHGNLTKKEQM